MRSLCSENREDRRGRVIDPVSTDRFIWRGESAPGKIAWVEACAEIDIEPEGVVRFDHSGRTFAIYRTADERFFATDGLCTHEKVHLADGLVIDTIIECPKHNGRFDFTTGEAKGAPVCIDLETYPVKLVDGRVFLEISV